MRSDARRRTSRITRALASVTPAACGRKRGGHSSRGSPMKNRKTLIAVVAVSLAVAAPLLVLAKGQPARPAPSPAAQAAYAEMKAGFGITPSFALAVPESAI